MKLLVFLLLTLNGFAQDSTFYVRTTGPMPFMEYGPGDDRLGGAKMSYLDSNLLLKVVDSFNTDYIVQLSRQHKGYISKQSTRRDSVTAAQPFHLSSSWRVYGDEKHDYISIALDERLPYRSQHAFNPSKLIIDIFGVTTNTNWITQTGTAKEITNTWYEQLEDDVLRVHIELKHKQHWGHYIAYDSASRKMLIKVKRQPSLKMKDLVVAIDAGHGGANTGAAGRTTRILEKEYTLRFANELYKKLHQKRVGTFMTRTSDIDISMIDRALMLRAQDPDLLISLHLNSSANTSVKGTSTYYRYIGFRPLTEKILECMLDLGLANFGNVGAFNFALSGPTEYPNCLVEIAFLSNADDERLINDKKFQQKVAKQIHKGIRKWLKEVKRQD